MAKHPCVDCGRDRECSGVRCWDCQRILADSGFPASSTLVVDDNANAIAWSTQAGMRTVHMRRNGDLAPAADHVVGSLLELVDLLNGR